MMGIFCTAEGTSACRTVGFCSGIMATPCAVTFAHPVWRLPAENTAAGRCAGIEDDQVRPGFAAFFDGLCYGLRIIFQWA